MEESQTSSLEHAAQLALHNRGVTIDDITDLVYFLQVQYHPELSVDTCRHNVKRVLAKREVQNAILTGIAIDQLAEQNQLDEPLASIVKQDEGLYGVDEVIAFAIVNVYGSIGLTNFGYIDKQKPGILAKLNDKSDPHCHTFLDDIVGAIAAAASSRLAHRAENAEC